MDGPSRPSLYEILDVSENHIYSVWRSMCQLNKICENALRSHLYMIGMAIPWTVHPMSYLEDAFHSGLYVPIQSTSRNTRIISRFISEVYQRKIAPTLADMICLSNADIERMCGSPVVCASRRELFTEALNLMRRRIINECKLDTRSFGGHESEEEFIEDEEDW